MANAVILILVIGYCLFLIYKQVQNGGPDYGRFSDRTPR